MKYIQKQEVPPEFLEWQAKSNENWQADWDNFQNPEKRIVHQSLLTEQGYICCYCQRRISLNDSHIEHFKPKDKKYYPELALDYSNLLSSCQKERQKREPRHCGSLKDNWYDEKLTVSPLKENCIEYFHYAIDGQIIPNKQKDKLEAAQITIDKLGLNIPNLIRERRGVIETIITLISSLNEKTLEEKIRIIELQIAYKKKLDVEARYQEFCAVQIFILQKYLNSFKKRN